MAGMKAQWYWNRLRRMSLSEIVGRIRVAAQQSIWALKVHRPGKVAQPGGQKATVNLPPAWQNPARVTSEADQKVIAVADEVLAGGWPVFNARRTGVPAEPNWFLDPLTGVEAPRRGYAFRLPVRDPSRVGSLKHVWEPSRHQTTTLLAVAWWLTGNPAYANRVASHLKSWWRDNPFLEGIHWTSGIEVGLRLISWTWIRALLADWEGCESLFDRNETFVLQVYQHQRYLVALHSCGSSANNHLIAELAGLACASAAFPWFEQSEHWRIWSYRCLAHEAIQQTHADGFNREQASEYHLFVLEMFLATSLTTKLAGKPIGAELNAVVQQMADALAATVDGTGRAPRFGDGDEGRGLLVDAPEAEPTGVVLTAARCLVGAAPWWPENSGQASVLADITMQISGRPERDRNVPCPVVFAGSGQAIMRAGRGGEEIWVRCDHGPVGYLSIAAHGHADALSVELRSGGVELLADPGTFCYHDRSEWRRYFKGTSGHNTLAVDDLDQVEYGGPFLWLAGLSPKLETCRVGGTYVVQEWQAQHDGYRRLTDPVTHHRRVALDTRSRSVAIEDWIDANRPHNVTLSFHLGPTIAATLGQTIAHLQWNLSGQPRRGKISLPPELRWTLHFGETNPPLGWYSRGFGQREPAATLVGRGLLTPGQRLCSSIDLRFPSSGKPTPGREKECSANTLES